MRRLTAIMLFFVAGCRSTSIITLVERPAEIDIPRDATVLLYTCNAAPPSVDMDAPRAVRMLGDALEASLSSAAFRHIHSPDDCLMRDTAAACPPNPAMWLDCDADYSIAASIGDLRFDEQVINAEIRRGDERGLYKTVRKGVLRCAVRCQVTNLRQKRVVATTDESVVLNAESFEANAAPPPIGCDSLLQSAMARLVERFHARLTPRTDRVTVSFLLDGGFPDIPRGIREAEHGRWANAVEVFARIADSARGRDGEDRMLYNLGIAHQYARNFRAAYEAFDRAETLHSSGRYREAMRACLDMEKDFAP